MLLSIYTDDYVVLQRMEFKRLNNMTGRDPVLNRRITTIFINQIEEFKNMLGTIDEKPISSVEFTMHKIRPSLVIFELDMIIKEFSTLTELIQDKDKTDELKEKCTEIISHIDDSLVKLKTFLNSIA